MDFNIIKLPKVESTNSYVQQQLEKKALHEGDVVTTLYQQNGKGQGGNIWESEPGCNLLASIVLEPKVIHASKQFVLTQMVSLAIIDLLKNNISNSDITIKWPNDIYVGEKKIAGILFQNFIKGNSIEYSIVGIGINVNQLKFSSSAPNPISIIHFTNKLTDISILLDQLLYGIGINYEKYSSEISFPEIKSKYIDNLFQRNIWANYSNGKNIFSGKIVDVDEFGRLILQLESGEERIFMFKEIEFCLSKKL